MYSDTKTTLSQALLEYIRTRPGMMQCDPVGFRGFMSDSCPGASRDIFVLERCLVAGIADEIARGNGDFTPLVRDRCVRRLQAMFALEHDAAELSVDTWASALHTSCGKGVEMQKHVEQTVSVSSDADFHAALQNTKHPVEIVLGRGTYHAPKVLDGDLRIRGMGKPHETVLIVTHPDGMGMRADTIELENLALRPDPKNKKATTSLDIAYGTMRVSKCLVHGMVRVHGASARLSADNSLFHDNSHILFSDYAGGMIEDTTIESCCSITTHASPAFRSVKAEGSISCDVLSTPSFTACDITGSCIISRGSSARMAGCHVTMEKKSRLLVKSAAALTGTDCRFTGNETLIDGASAHLENCLFEGGDTTGLRFVHEARSELRDCEVRDYAVTGISIRSRSTVVLKNSLISDIGSVGILVRDRDSALTTTNCVVGTCGEAGIMVMTQASARLDTDTFKFGKRSGIRVRKKGVVIASHLSVFKHDQYGIQVESGGYCSCDDCTIKNNRGSGIHVSKSKTVIDSCFITKNAYNGIIADSRSQMLVKGGSITKNGANGILIRKGGRIVIEQNTISENGITGVLVTKGGRLESDNSRIHDGRHAGIVVEKGLVDLFSVCIAGNAGPGMVVGRRARVVLSGCVIDKSAVSPVLVHEGGRLNAKDTTWQANSVPSIECRDRGRIRLHHCYIQDNDAPGLLVGPKGMVILTGSLITRNKGGGIIIREHGRATAWKSFINGNDGRGVMLTGGRFTSLLSRIEYNTAEGIAGAGILRLFITALQRERGAKFKGRYQLFALRMRSPQEPSTVQGATICQNSKKEHDCAV